MEWWVKKVQDNASASLCRVVLQSGALEMIAEIEACRTCRKAINSLRWPMRAIV